MNVDLTTTAEKQFRRLNEPLKGRIATALRKLEHEPPQGDIKALAGMDGFRVRVGGYRILFEILGNSIVVYGIDSRGQVYKRG